MDFSKVDCYEMVDDDCAHFMVGLDPDNDMLTGEQIQEKYQIGLDILDCEIEFLGIERYHNKGYELYEIRCKNA